MESTVVYLLIYFEPISFQQYIYIFCMSAIVADLQFSIVQFPIARTYPLSSGLLIFIM